MLAKETRNGLRFTGMLHFNAIIHNMTVQNLTLCSEVSGGTSEVLLDINSRSQVCTD